MITMTQIFEVNSNLTAKMVTCMLCDCKMRESVQSIATDSAIKDFYKALAQKRSMICRDYTLLKFIQLIKSYKAYLAANPSKSLAIQKELLDHNIALFNYSKEVKECYEKVKAIASWLEIKDINNVAFVDGQYIYMEDGKEYILEENCMIIRPSDPLVGDTIMYLGKTNEELQKQTGATRPARGWYSMEVGINYFAARDITVKRWFVLDDYHKRYTMEEE